MTCFGPRLPFICFVVLPESSVLTLYFEDLAPSVTASYSPGGQTRCSSRKSTPALHLPAHSGQCLTTLAMTLQGLNLPTSDNQDRNASAFLPVEGKKGDVGHTERVPVTADELPLLKCWGVSCLLGYGLFGTLEYLHIYNEAPWVLDPKLNFFVCVLFTHIHTEAIQNKNFIASDF